MKKLLKLSVMIVETLLIIGCLGAVSYGVFDKWLLFIPYLSYGFAAGAIVLLVAIVLTSIRPKPLFKSRLIALVVSLLVVCAVHLTTKALPAYGMSFIYPNSGMYFLYSMCILIYAVCASWPQFVGVLVLCISGEALNCASHGYFNGLCAVHSPQWLDFALGRGIIVAPPFLFMALVGFVAFVLSVLRNNQNVLPQKHQRVSLSQQMRNNENPSEAAQDQRYLKSSGNTSLLIVRPESEDSDSKKTLLSSIVYFMARNFKAYSAMGFIYEPQSRSFVLNSYHSKSLSIIKDIRIPEGKGVVGALALDKQPFISGDLSYYSTELLYYQRNEIINSVVAVPIISDTKELLGALVIDSQDKQAFKEDHKDIMRRFSVLAAALVTNVRMRIYQESAAKQFQIFYEASQQFITALHLSEVFDVLVSMVELLTPFTRIIAMTYNERDSTGQVIKVKGNSPDLQEGFKFQLNSGIYSYVLKKLKLVNLPDFQEVKEKYYRLSPGESVPDNLRALIVIPILDNESRPSGLLSIESEVPGQFQGDLEKILFTLIGNASVAITRARLYRNMELLAITDGLTQLINHKHFQEQLTKELERTKRYKRPMALLLMDIDHFKNFNDTYGHPVGDLVLREIAKCIQQAIRVNDIAARYGGEEFTVIIPDSGPEGALITAERIRNQVEQKVIISGENKLHVTLSIGCASYPAQAASQQEIIDYADKALYYSKETGRNRSTLFSKGMGKKD